MKNMPCCRAFAKKLNDAPLAIVDKRRSAHNTSEVMNLIGDVDGKVAVLVDDMIDTAGTITNAAKVRTQTLRGPLMITTAVYNSAFPAHSGQVTPGKV